MGTTLQLRDLDTYGNFIHNQWVTPFGGGSGFLNGNPGVVPFVEAVGFTHVTTTVSGFQWSVYRDNVSRRNRRSIESSHRVVYGVPGLNNIGVNYSFLITGPIEVEVPRFN
ncbi:MAG: hypothetical protein R8G66_32390 [Cytophagales bacterium]|nr:hypothetical protein [Cytophagales bacterium]